MKWSEVAQSCLALCDPMDCSPPGSSVHRILQARVLEWVAISFSRGSSQPRARTQVSCITGRCFNLCATREPPGLLRQSFCIFFISFSWRWFWSSLPLQCYKTPSIVLQALCLPDLIFWIYSLLPLYNHKAFDLGHTCMAYWLSPLPSSLNLTIRSLWSEPQSAPGFVFADCIQLLHLWLQRI